MVSRGIVGEELQKTKLYKFVLWKAYFDKGYAWVSFPKYLFLAAGFGSMLLTEGESTNEVVLIGILIGIGCLILGKILYKHNVVDAELEVQNVFNPFQREVRDYMEVSGANRKA